MIIDINRLMIVLLMLTDPAAEAPEGLSRALADITVTGDHRNLGIISESTDEDIFQEELQEGENGPIYDSPFQQA